MQSLWNLLSLKRLILLTEHGQDGFDKIDDQYKVMIENQTEDEVSLDQENDASEASSSLYDKTNENSSSKSFSNFELALMEKICKEKKKSHISAARLAKGKLQAYLSRRYKGPVAKIITSFFDFS